jgi:hypothetical protein
MSPYKLWIHDVKTLTLVSTLHVSIPISKSNGFSVSDLRNLEVRIIRNKMFVLDIKYKIYSKFCGVNWASVLILIIIVGDITLQLLNVITQRERETVDM